MTRTPFIAALTLLALVPSQPGAVPPRRPAPQVAAPHIAAAPHLAAPHPSFSRPAAPHSAVPPHTGFVPTGPQQVARPAIQPARPAVSPRPTAPSITTGPRISSPNVVNRPDYGRTRVNQPTINQTTVNRNVYRPTTANRWNVVGNTQYGSNPYAGRRYAGRRSGGVGGYATPGYRWGVGGGRQIGAPATWYSEPGNWGRSWWGGRPAWNWGRPWYWQHSGWHHGFWDYWAAPPALWFGAGLAAGWLYSPYDTMTYFNPYFGGVADVSPYLNYAVPLPAVSAEADAIAFPPAPDTLGDPDAVPAPPTDPAVVNANRILDDGRAAFKVGDYPKTQMLAEEAIKANPSDPTLHEFRALALFAQAKYQDMAADLFAVLAAGPGWDWPTMRDQYPDVDAYTAQLRALERYVGDNPTAAYGHFDLAYHYLVTGAKDAAIRELQQVVKLQPDDKLSAGLLQSLTNPQPAADATGPPMPGR